MNVQELAVQIQDSFLSVFPNSYCSAVVHRSIVGESDIVVRIILAKDKSECSNRIIQNDPMHQLFWVYGGRSDGSFYDKISIEGGSGIDVKASNPHHYCERVKLFRKVNAKSPEAIVKKFNEIFLKYKQAIIDNIDGVQAICPIDVRSKVGI